MTATLPAAGAPTPATPPAAGIHVPKRRRPSRRAAITGWLFALPTALFVLLLFALPLLLVLQMSGSDWPLLGGNQGWNFPENYQDAVSNRFFWDSIGFTLKYTILTTIILLALSLGLALLVQESTRWKGAAAHVDSSCRAPSAWHPPRCSSTCSTRRSPARSPT